MRRAGTGYVERVEHQGVAGYYIAGSRVSLDSVVHAFHRGESPKGIVDSWPSLTLDQVMGSLIFYQTNREVVDQYLVEGEESFRNLREQIRTANATTYSKLTRGGSGVDRP